MRRLLDDRETAIQAAASLEAELPQVKEFLAAYQKATTPEARRFAGAFLTLKFPGLRPFVSAGVGRTTAVDDVDSYRDNYWCTDPPAPQGGPPSEDAQGKSKSVAAPDFLKTAQTLAARQSMPHYRRWGPVLTIFVVCRLNGPRRIRRTHAPRKLCIWR